MLGGAVRGTVGCVGILQGTSPNAVCVAHFVLGVVYLGIVYFLVRNRSERQRWAAVQGAVAAWVLVLLAMIPYFNFAMTFEGRSLGTDLVLLVGIAFPLIVYAAAPWLAIRWLRDVDDESEEEGEDR